MTYSKYLLLVGVVWALASCQREDKPLDVPENGAPIELSASPEWPGFTKGLIHGLSDLTGDGFVVWSSWTEALTQTANSNAAVFGTYGTIVNAVDRDENDVFNPLQGDRWEYSPLKFWHDGFYTFAALLPASSFDTQISYNKLFSVHEGRVSGTATSPVYNNSLILDGTVTLGGVGSSGFTLEDQVDLMYAFENVKYSSTATNSTSTVSFTFNHLWAQLGLEFQSVEPNGKTIDIKQVKVYGIPSSIDFDASVSLTSVQSKNLTSIRKALAGTSASTSAAPFAVFNKPTEGSDVQKWNVGSTKVKLVDGLMVFPVAFTSTPLTIEVTYGNGKILTGSISSGELVSGNRYVYTLTLGANSINFGEPTVTGWANRTDINVDIEKFVIL